LAGSVLVHAMAGGEYEVSAIRAIAEASVVISFAFVGTILAGFLMTVLLGLAALIPAPWNLVGLALAIGGGASLVYCGRFLSRQGRGTPYPRRPPKRLVTTGPFARVRNPIIASWGALMIGLGIWSNWTGLLLLTILAFPLIQAYLVYREEPVLLRRFGAEYEAYRSRVPRWVPRLRS
jgi:protein-S-isoprenylcysteine O-methyltransferase Ste14